MDGNAGIRGESVEMTRSGFKRCSKNEQPTLAIENSLFVQRFPKQALSGLCYGREAIVAHTGRDRYGRTIGRVRCGGVDANAEQIKRGMAWVYDRYATDKRLYPMQAEAQADRRGLWADAAPVPPWEWRKSRRNGKGA